MYSMVSIKILNCSSYIFYYSTRKGLVLSENILILRASSLLANCMSILCQTNKKTGKYDIDE